MSDSQAAERILVVDDDDNVRYAVRRTLSRLGYEVHEASNGAEGLDLARSLGALVVVLDLRMPEMDGHTFLRRLGLDCRRCAVIVSSGAGEMDDVIDVMRLGAVDYLKKPWTPSELVASVMRAFELLDQRPVPGAEAPAPEEEPSGQPGRDSFADVLERIRRGEIGLPAVPGVVIQLRALLQAPGTQLRQVIDTVSQDQRLASDVLRLANSALHAGLQPSRDLRTAITRVGFRSLQGIVETSFAHRFYSVEGPVVGDLMRQVWRFSLARAILARAMAGLAACAPAPDPETAYLAGLFADAGASFLLKALDEIGIDSSAAGGEKAVVHLLQEQHQAAGHVVLEHWGLEEAVARYAAAHHHEPALPDAYFHLGVLAHGLIFQTGGLPDVTSPEGPSTGRLERSALELRIGQAAIDGVRRRVSTHIWDVLAVIG